MKNTGRERCGCFMKQPPHEQKFRTMRQLLYSTIVQFNVVIQLTNFPLLVAQIEDN
jgi:hypothetical protein